MKNNNTKVKKTKSNLIASVKKRKKIILLVFLLCVITYAIYLVVSLVKNPTDTFLVEQGKIYQEEMATGYIIRNETVLKGENYKNGMAQIKGEGEKIAKGEAVFRYYSSGEENLNKKIEELDQKIDEAMANESDLFSSDIKVLEDKIKEKLNAIYRESDIQKIEEYKKEINDCIIKKAKIAGDLSPSGSYLKKLIDERSSYEKKLNSGAEYLKSPTSGVVSYKVDGYEEILTTQDFSKINKKTLKSINVKTGQIIATNEESGKIVDNYCCYIATILSSEHAMQAEVGKEIKLRLPNGEEVPASIEHIQKEDNDYIIVFKIEKQVEELIQYRKILIDVIWWSDSGKKVPNSAIQYEEKGENKIPYVIRVRAGYEDKIIVKILRQNENYSIVTTYTSTDLEELGYTKEEINSRKVIALYDEILINP